VPKKKNKLEQLRLLREQQSVDMPKFFFDRNVITITGRAMPEFAGMAWAPLLEKIDDFVKGKKNIVFNFNLDYFNSASSRYVTDLFSRLEKLWPSTHTEVNWFFDADDESTEAHAEIYKSIHQKLKFKILER
jgi:hypothetical protein